MMYGNLNLLFAGNLGFAQGLPAIVSAAAILQQNNVKINIVLLGEGVAKCDAISLAEEKHLNNMFFLPRVTMLEVGGLLSKADMLLVHLTKNELFEITVPSRTQANLAMGVLGDAAELITRAKAGMTCEPDNPQSLADAITKFSSLSVLERKDMGNNGRDFYYKELSLKSGVAKFIRIFEDIK